MEAADLWLCINVEFSGGVFSSQLSVYVCVCLCMCGVRSRRVGGGAFSCQRGSVLCQQVSQLSQQNNKGCIFFIFGERGERGV